MSPTKRELLDRVDELELTCLLLNERIARLTEMLNNATQREQSLERQVIAQTTQHELLTTRYDELATRYTKLARRSARLEQWIRERGL